jgi:hypothetical protein
MDSPFKMYLFGMGALLVVAGAFWWLASGYCWVAS